MLITNRPRLITEIMGILEVSIKFICGHRKFGASNLLAINETDGGVKIQILAIFLANNIDRGYQLS